MTFDQFALPVDGDGHQTAAGAALDLGLGQLLLGAHELTLHLRRRSEELLHVKLSAWFHAALLCLVLRQDN